MPPAILCPRLAVLVSGGGTTLQNLLDRVAAGRLTARIVGVIASNPDAHALQRARAASVPARVIGPPEPALSCTFPPSMCMATRQESSMRALNLSQPTTMVLRTYSQKNSLLRSRGNTGRIQQF